MKKLLLSLLAIIAVCSTASALGVYSGTNFFPYSFYWDYKLENSDDSGKDIVLEIATPETEAECDTVVEFISPINGNLETRNCTKLIFLVNSDEMFRIAAYEENGRIYVHSPETKEFTLYMDFSVSEGESVNLDGKDVTVETVDFIYDRALLKRVKLSGNETSSTWVWNFGPEKIVVPEGSKLPAGEYHFVSSAGGIPSTSGDNYYWTSDIFTMPTFNPENEYYSIGKFWKYSATSINGSGTTSYFGKVVEGDLDKCHVPCRKLTRTNADGTELSDSFEYVCDNGGITYVYDDASEQFIELLNFNIGVLHEAQYDNTDSKVIKIDEIEVQNVIRKRFTFQGYDKDSIWKYWVEGIGESDGNVIPTGMIATDEIIRTEQVFENGKCVFEYCDFANPNVGVYGIGVDENNQTSGNGRIYNLKGQSVDRIIIGEPFIRDGKVYINR